jgi:hypothetical protein
MLVHPGDRGIHRHHPIDVTGRIGLGLQLTQHLVPGAIGGKPPVSFPRGLPRSELLRQITPGHARAKPEHDPFDHLPVITKRPPPTSIRGWQQRLDPRPTLISQHRGPRHHPSIQPQHAKIRETRPDMWAGLSSGQGEAVSPAVAGETASVRSVAGGDGRVGVDAWSL